MKEKIRLGEKRMTFNFISAVNRIFKKRKLKPTKKVISTPSFM